MHRVFPWGKNNIESSLILRPQNSNTEESCAYPRSANFCIVLVESLIPSCSKWPTSFFHTEPNAPTTTGTTFVLDFQILLISIARSCYFSYFSDSLCNRLLSLGPAMSTMLIVSFNLPSFFELQHLASCD